MTNLELAALIVDRMLGISGDNERRETTISVRGPSRSSVLRTWHLVKDVAEVLEEEGVSQHG